ncbi:D-glycero-beta-D-manno-heptose-7-phosphate kinase [Zavarzinia sp. CC-PAN008]|uniref:D-glycero-beta-D-manno-heptose-7-phosphate kinase n=1 Tax=Zavarzinia sp. CC-PAN008 TaxID=3243332 RepID=UPI003F747CA0
MLRSQDHSLHDLIARFPQATVLVVGDVMLDRFVYGRAERLSPEAPIPVLTVERETEMCGGAGNVARNVASLGGQAIVVGVIGRDRDGAALNALLVAEAGIDPHLVTDPGRPTTCKTRFVAGQQLLRADRETAQPVDAQADAVIAAVVEALPKCDLVLLSDYAKGVLTDPVLGAVIAAASAAGKPIIADPKSRDFARYRGVDVLTPNRGELALGTGLAAETGAQVDAAAQAVRAQTGIGAVLVTMGEQGMRLATDGPPLALAAAAREVFDVSGAGDTVIAVLALSLACGGDLPTAARLANAAAGLVVAKRGTAVVSPEELGEVLHADSGGLLSPARLRQRIQAWRSQGLRVGFTNGCFDLLHSGHVSLLAQARAACDRLVVGLNSDASVRRLKGPSRPIQDQAARAAVLSALSSVDAVTFFDEDTPLKLIEAIRPNVLIKGADYREDQVVGAPFVRAHGGEVVLVPLVEGHSTTRLVERATAG